MSVRHDPQREEAIRRLEKVRAARVAELDGLRVELETIDQAIGLLRAGPTLPKYDTVSLKDVAEKVVVPKPADEAAAPNARAVRPPSRLEAPAPTASPSATLPERVLAFVSQHPNSASREIAEGTGIGLSSVFATVSPLVKQGRLARHETVDGRGATYSIPGAPAPPVAAEKIEKRASDETVAKVREVLTPPPGNTPGWIEEKTGLSAPAVRRALKRLVDDGEAERSGGKQGLNVRYALKIKGIVTSGPPGSMKVATSVENARAGRAADLAEPAPKPTAPPVAPSKANGAAKPVELTGALKLVAADILKWLQIGPANLDELQRRTDWPMQSLTFVAEYLKAEGKITGTARLSLKAGEA